MAAVHSHYLEQKLEEFDRDFLVTRNFVTGTDRLFLSALHTLRAELKGIARAVHDRGVALNKIQWWQNEWRCLAERKARHPVTQVLQEKLREPPSLASASLALAQVCGVDHAWQSLPDLVEYAERLAEPFAALEAAISGSAPASDDLQRCWRDIELASAVTDMDRHARVSKGRPAASLAAQDLAGQALDLVSKDYNGCGAWHAHIYREVQILRLRWLKKRHQSSAGPSSMRCLWVAWRGARVSRR